MVLKLQKVIEQFEYNKASVVEVLSTFHAVDGSSRREVEDFLVGHAYDMEMDGQSITYLWLNDERLVNNEYIIDGYFTLAIKSFEFSEGVSKRNRRKLSGKSDDHVPAYLIGQLAKSETAEGGVGRKLLSLAIEYIRAARENVGGRLIYLDCKDELVEYYKKNGFKLLQQVDMSGEEYNQMYLVL